MCFIMIKKTGDDNMKFSYAKLIWYLIGSYGWLVSGFVISQMGINDTLVNTQYQVLRVLSTSKVFLLDYKFFGSNQEVSNIPSHNI